MEFVRRVLRRRARRRGADDGFPGDDRWRTELADFDSGFDDPLDAARGVTARRPSPVRRYLGAAGERLRHSPVFAPFSRLSVGLTYEGAAVKLLVCEQHRVISWETIPFDPRLVSGTVIAEPYNLGRLLRDVFARRGLPRFRVHCALPAAGALSRIVEVPRLNARERRRTIVAEAMRSLGVSPGRHYVYWQTVDRLPEADLVFVLAVPRDAMRSLIETMRAAGVRPRTVDVTPLALARGVGQSDAIILELDPTGVDLVVVQDDIPLAMRSIVFGDRALTLEEAQEAAVELLMSEIRRYEDIYVGSRIDAAVPVYLAGDLGGGLRLADRIRSVSGHPLGRIAPLIDYPDEFPIAEYVANVGLVLKEL